MKLFLLLITLTFLSQCSSNAQNSRSSKIQKSALNIAKFESDSTNSVTVNYDSLDLLLLTPEVKDRKVVVVSIVGKARDGKSFFFNYCLRFMYANVSFIIYFLQLLRFTKYEH